MPKDGNLQPLSMTSPYHPTSSLSSVWQHLHHQPLFSGYRNNQTAPKSRVTTSDTILRHAQSIDSYRGRDGGDGIVNPMPRLFETRLAERNRVAQHHHLRHPRARGRPLHVCLRARGGRGRGVLQEPALREGLTWHQHPPRLVLLTSGVYTSTY